MKSSSLRIFKFLYNRRTISLMCNSLKATVKKEKTKITEKLSFEVSETTALIKKYQSPIPWDQVTKALGESNEDVKKVILKSCSDLQDADITMSFYKYLVDKGENFNEISLFLIVKSLTNCPKAKILEYEELLIHLFKECLEFLRVSKIFLITAVQVFSYIPFCYRELIPLKENFESFQNELIICRAFDFDDLSTAWKFLELSNLSISEKILKSFIDYCIRRALENNFSIDLIQTFVNACQKNEHAISSSNIICSLQPLINVLIYCKDDYIWSLKKCTVNNQMECLNCNTVLKKIDFSENEFQTLKNAVCEVLIPKKDVFLKTTQLELEKFNDFLSTCRPYDFVVDGLNFIYRGYNTRKKNIISHVLANYIVQKERKVLIISKQHFKNHKIFKTLPNSQVFFTEDTSDDDVFIVYAAMHRGLGTDILTSDFLTTHSAKLGAKIKKLFIKWQLGHQFIIDGCLGIVPPRYHLGLPQCTESPETGGDSYKWHLPYIEKSTSSFTFQTNFNWICLQAVPKKNLEIYQKHFRKNFKSTNYSKNAIK